MRRLKIPLLLSSFAASAVLAQNVTSPKQQFGHDIGADYVLTNYKQLYDYFHKLDRESDRMKVVSMGKTEEGRDQIMAIVSSPANMRSLDKYRDISERLARAEALTDEQAQKLAKEGKAVVWIDGGLHASEVLCAQALIEMAYQMVSGKDEETMRILDKVIILFVHANPDGQDLVSNWYMRNSDPMRRSIGNLPRLYQKYIGHDNNRDFYASTQRETKNMNRIMYREWYPQIVYNHHQTGPAGTVMFAPPFRDPFNHHYDPLVTTGTELVGMAMHHRFALEGKPGTTMREGASYSMWWNGGLRTTSYFHNMIGILTETIGNPTPMEIPFVASKQVPNADIPFPIKPQRWHFRQSIDYSITANRAILDLASRQPDKFLLNMYRMGRNSIERGSQDYWTHYPSRVDAATREGGRDQDRVQQILQAPDKRDPRGYFLPADQADFPTAIKFVNALIETGIDVHRATRQFSVGGKAYPAGSLVVKSAQAFRLHVMDMFEPQDHPNDFVAPGAPPTPPYDNAGYTLAMQMGVKYDRILEAFDGPFEKVKDVLPIPAGAVTPGTRGYAFSHESNNSFIALNRLMKEGYEVSWLRESWSNTDRQWPVGTMYLHAKPGLDEKLKRIAADTGVNFFGTSGGSIGGELAMKQPRIGLADRYGGLMPSGWTRWILEQFEFPYKVVFPQELDAGNLRDKYDVLIFVDGAIPASEGGGGGGGGGQNVDVPAEFQSWLGRITVANTVPKLKQFMEAGGTVITIGSSTALARHLGVGLTSATVGEDGRALPSSKYYIPGSLLEVKVDNTKPIAWGMPERAIVMFDNSPAFRLQPGGNNVISATPLASFDSKTPLRSGWAWGQEVLDGAVAMAQADIGAGKLYLFGPEIAFRAQPHGTFKLLFNGICLSAAK